MLTKGNEFFYSIKGLLVPQKSVHDTLIEDIEEYVTIIPEFTDKLMDNLNHERMPYVISNLNALTAILKNIYARWLVTDAESALRVARFNDVKKCKSKIQTLISDLRALSIEIQMVRMCEVRDEDVTQSKIERYTDVINNLSAVGYYVFNEEYDTAYGMLSDMEDLAYDGIATTLKEVVRLQKQEEAGKVILDLKNEYVQKIIRLGGSDSHFKKTILTVDDRPDILKTVSGILGEHYKVHGLTGAKVALKFLEKHKPDLFILDIEMPGMDGYELAREIRKREGFHKTPLLFLTSNSTKEHVIQAVKSGANDFIVKPAKADTLLAKVGKYLL